MEYGHRKNWRITLGHWGALPVKVSFSFLFICPKQENLFTPFSPLNPKGEFWIS